jgi:hypothetical protein
MVHPDILADPANSSFVDQLYDDPAPVLPHAPVLADHLSGPTLPAVVRVNAQKHLRFLKDPGAEGFAGLWEAGSTGENVSDMTLYLDALEELYA